MLSRRDLLCCLAAAPLVRAQSQPPSKFTTDVKVVNVFATVRNRKGQIVRDLGKDDFVLEEDGRPQAIHYFSRESDLPLTLGLLVDISPSQRRVLEQERGASYKFFDQMLREDKDQAFVIQFDAEVELLQEVTNSRTLLQRALRNMTAAPPMPLYRRDMPWPRPRGGTSLYDAVLLASEEVMRRQTGRKALVVLTDGVDTASRVTLDDAIAAAQRADTGVYSILFADREAYGSTVPSGWGGRNRRGNRTPATGRLSDGMRVLEQFSRESGGGFFDGSQKMTLEEIYRQIQDELRSQYSLGYTPEQDTGPGFRRIHLMTKDQSLVVQARDGYYAEK